LRPDLVIHAAAQPSHDLSARRPLDDFDVNACGTLNLLEACRRHAPQAVFVFVSTNKVYGDGPNHLQLAEHATRFDFADPQFSHGIAESFPIDRTLHSPFGASKLAADVMVQEYGRYYGLRTGVFRCGCITGAAQAGVELHGFLNYLVGVAVRGAPYTIYGYQGKQVRDQLHSRDLASAIWHFAQAPRAGEVYNLGGGKENAASILECLELIEQLSGKRPQISYSDRHRLGDHICYYSDTRKFQADYPQWRVTCSLNAIIQQMLAGPLASAANRSQACAPRH
jgi:CDP-paratose 2-epimerase